MKWKAQHDSFSSFPALLGGRAATTEITESLNPITAPQLHHRKARRGRSSRGRQRGERQEPAGRRQDAAPSSRLRPERGQDARRSRPRPSSADGQPEPPGSGADLSSARKAAGSTSGSSISAEVVAMPPLNIASKTALPAASTKRWAGMRCWPGPGGAAPAPPPRGPPLPTTKCTSLSSSLEKRKAKRSRSEPLVACQLYSGSRCSTAPLSAAAAPLVAAAEAPVAAGGASTGAPPAAAAITALRGRAGPNPHSAGGTSISAARRDVSSSLRMRRDLSAQARDGTVPARRARPCPRVGGGRERGCVRRRFGEGGRCPACRGGVLPAGRPSWTVRRREGVPCRGAEICLGALTGKTSMGASFNYLWNNIKIWTPVGCVRCAVYV